MVDPGWELKARDLKFNAWHKANVCVYVHMCVHAHTHTSMSDEEEE